MSMVCKDCGRGPRDGVTLHRTNDKGQPGIWACESHRSRDKVIDPLVNEVVGIIEQAQLTSTDIH